jgi:hypothetical protein
MIGLSGYLGGELDYEHEVRVGEDHDGIPGRPRSEHPVMREEMSIKC